MKHPRSCASALLTLRIRNRIRDDPPAVIRIGSPGTDEPQETAIRLERESPTHALTTDSLLWFGFDAHELEAGEGDSARCVLGKCLDRFVAGCGREERMVEDVADGTE